jgi:hypothetical protein
MLNPVAGPAPTAWLPATGGVVADNRRRLAEPADDRPHR